MRDKVEVMLEAMFLDKDEKIAQLEAEVEKLNQEISYMRFEIDFLSSQIPENGWQ